MLKFKDLNFKPHRNHGDGVQAIENFANGYGVSVIKTRYSYGGEDGLYELAVLHDGDLCYDTPITSDVMGWLNPADVTRTMIKVQKLPAKA